MDPIRRPIHPRIQRRRDLAASLHIPPEPGAKFTEGEFAVFKIVSGRSRQAQRLHADLGRHRRHVHHHSPRGDDRDPKAEGLIKVERGRRYRTITLSAAWKAWLDRYGDAPPDGPR
jgi:hypothetical protein